MKSKNLECYRLKLLKSLKKYTVDHKAHHNSDVKKSMKPCLVDKYYNHQMMTPKTSQFGKNNATNAEIKAVNNNKESLGTDSHRKNAPASRGGGAQNKTSTKSGALQVTSCYFSKRYQLNAILTGSINRITVIDITETLKNEFRIDPKYLETEAIHNSNSTSRQRYTKDNNTCTFQIFKTLQQGNGYPIIFNRYRYLLSVPI